MKPKTKSRTILFHVAMAAVESIHASIAILQPILTMEQFAAVSLIIGAIHSGGGVYLRTITSEPVA